MITLLDSPRAKDERTLRTARIEPKTAVVIKVRLIDIATSGPAADKEAKEEQQRLLSLMYVIGNHVIEHRGGLRKGDL